LFYARGIDRLVLAGLQRISNADKKVGRLEWLLDEIERATLDGGHRHLDVTVRGDQDNWRNDTARIETMHEFEARKAWQANVGDDAVEPSAGVECGEERLGCGKAHGLETLSVQVEMQGVEHGRIVVYQRDADWLTHGPASHRGQLGSR